MLGNVCVCVSENEFNRIFFAACCSVSRRSITLICVQILQDVYSLSYSVIFIFFWKWRGGKWLASLTSSKLDCIASQCCLWLDPRWVCQGMHCTVFALVMDAICMYCLVHMCGGVWRPEFESRLDCWNQGLQALAVVQVLWSSWRRWRPNAWRGWVMNSAASMIGIAAAPGSVFAVTVSVQQWIPYTNRNQVSMTAGITVECIMPKLYSAEKIQN